MKLRTVRKIIQIQQISSIFIEHSLCIRDLLDSIWLTLTTLTTVGYGDLTPKTLMGRTIAIIIAFIGNTVVLALPIAIIGLDFEKAYKENHEQETHQELKTKDITDLDYENIFELKKK